VSALRTEPLAALSLLFLSAPAARMSPGWSLVTMHTLNTRSAALGLSLHVLSTCNIYHNTQHCGALDQHSSKIIVIRNTKQNQIFFRRQTYASLNNWYAEVQLLSMFARLNVTVMHHNKTRELGKHLTNLLAKLSCLAYSFTARTPEGLLN
jgi:hypothetical protein